MTDYDPVIVTPADEFPISRNEVKRHLRVDHSDDDSLIDIYIGAASSTLDGPRGLLRKAIVTQVWSKRFDAFAKTLRLGLAPIASVDTVVYLDAEGDAVEVDEANWQAFDLTGSPYLRFNDDFDYPVTQDQRPTLTVTFTAGFGDPDEVPFDLKAAILFLVADMYDRRQATVEGSLEDNPIVARLLGAYRPPGVA